MRLLLDTHAWLWQLGAPERLSGRAAAALDDPANELHLSPISVWEAMVLARKGRLRLSVPAEEWIREALRRTPAAMVDLSHEIAIRSECLPGLAGSDPADRFIAATCLVEDLALVTSDRVLRKLRMLRTIW